uniref:Uncharacterized protein n=1 Tax=Anguilla anguilla TaxID=7936 RepID=A0A0E9WZL6_ANGAN
MLTRHKMGSNLYWWISVCCGREKRPSVRANEAECSNTVEKSLSIHRTQLIYLLKGDAGLMCRLYIPKCGDH